MGFKTDQEFLRFLTMGALGTRHVADEMKQRGFEPVELERCATSNKIWMTKVKRLRMPDLMCVRTGIRVEVRAKSNLEIRMSHTPANPARHWDHGLRDDDLVAFIVCREREDRVCVLGKGNYFTVHALRTSVDANSISRLKSAAEGSEQHLTWPSTVSSKRPGRVIRVEGQALTVEWCGDDDEPKRFTYRIGGRTPYVEANQRFDAGTQFLAGAPQAMADLGSLLRRAYDPIRELASPSAIDRFSAAKALQFRTDLHVAAQAEMARALQSEPDPRVALELASAAAAMGLNPGLDQLLTTAEAGTDPTMRMEAVLMLTEMGRRDASNKIEKALVAIASSSKPPDDEVRQAAVWGLGRAGIRAYRHLITLIADPIENVALHAIAAFGPDTEPAVIESLIAAFSGASTAQASALSESLRTIGSHEVALQLARAALASTPNRPWLLATLGRLRPETVEPLLSGSPLLAEIQPMLLTSEGSSPLYRETANLGLRFLAKQERWN